MKKNILIMVCMLSIVSIAHARFFIGIDGGYSMDRIDLEIEEKTNSKGEVTTPGSFIKKAYKGNGYLFNANLGTQHYFNTDETVGFRWLLNIAYGRTDLINQKNKNIFPSNVFDLGLGADLLLDILKFGNQNSLGIFGGVGGGIRFSLSDAVDYSDGFETSVLASPTPYISARTGISLSLAQHHRIEFIVRVPVGSWAPTNEDGVSYIYKPIQFMLGYKFVF